MTWILVCDAPWWKCGHLSAQIIVKCYESIYSPWINPRNEKSLNIFLEIGRYYTGHRAQFINQTSKMCRNPIILPETKISCMSNLSTVSCPKCYVVEKLNPRTLKNTLFTFHLRLSLIKWNWNPLVESRERERWETRGARARESIRTP